MDDQVLGLKEARWLVLSWELTAQDWYAQDHLLNMQEEAAAQCRWGCTAVSGDEPKRALQAQGSADLLHTAWQSPLLQAHVSIALECGIGALHVEVSLQRTGEAWQPWLPAPHGGQVWL